MEPFYEFGLNATQWLQTNYPGMEPVIRVFVYFGRFEFYLLCFLSFTGVSINAVAHISPI